MLNFNGCDPGAIEWVATYFRDCVYDVRDKVGFSLGLCSILVWLTAQLPQLIKNIKNQSSEALSIWFLVQWFAGDTLNLLGCLIQGQQLPTTTILAAYFVLMDVIMLLQYIYYGAIQARRKRMRAKVQRRRHHHHHHHHHHPKDGAHQGPSAIAGSVLPLSPGNPLPLTTDTDTATNPLLSPAVTEAAPRRGWGNLATAAAAAGLSLICISALALPHTTAPPTGGPLAPWLSYDTQAHSSPFLRAASPHTNAADGSAAAWPLGDHSSLVVTSATLSGDSNGDWIGDGGSGSGGGGKGGCRFLGCDIALVAGTAMGYLSTFCYLLSRVSQIRKNLARKSTAGLSPVMFVLTMSANMCTGASIVLRLRSVEQLKDQLPWMCGTFGTIALDCTLLLQTLTLGEHSHPHGQGGGEGWSRREADLEAPLLLGAEGEGQEPVVDGCAGEEGGGGLR